MSTMRFSILSLAAATLAACSYNPDYGDGTVQCGPGGLCPGNLTCDTTDNVCRSNPGGPIDAADSDGNVDTDGGVDIDAPLDVTPPNTILVSSPSAISGVNVTFIVDSTEPNSTFRCSVDSTTLVACTATQMFMNLAAGTHTFRAAATDMAGNEDTTPVEYTWMVDPTVLDTTITMGPGATSGANVSFSFTSTRPGTFECQLSPNETAFSSCSSPKAYTGLTQIAPPGYTFQVRAKDTAGNTDASPAMQTFMVDTTPPTVNITAPANNGTVGTSFTLTFTSETGATHTCQLDAQTVISPCNSGRMFTGLTSAANPHVIKVTGTDPFGNSATVMNTFSADDTGPSLTISGSPANASTTSSTTANLSFTIVPANEPTPFTFECKFNTAPSFTACTSFVMSGMTQGTQTLQVRAKDRFGNVGGVVTHTWDIQPMNTTIFAIRTTGIAVGTLVRLSTNIRVTGKTFNRYWVQEQDGATTPPPVSKGITVMPITPSSMPLSDATIVPGRAQTIIGTVTNMNGNLVIAQASYFNGNVLTPWSAKDTGRDSLILLSEQNEGMLLNAAGDALTQTQDQNCSNYDFCIESCARVTPYIYATDGITSGSLTIGSAHTFEGILEGEGTGFVYYVNVANRQSDACL